MKWTAKRKTAQVGDLSLIQALLGFIVVKYLF